MKPQFIKTPDGTELVVLTREDYESLLASNDDIEDLAAAVDGLESVRREGAIPSDVSRAIRGGANPVSAWRAHRGYSQAELGRRAGVTQTAIARIEAAPLGAGRAATRRSLADALQAPLWSFQ